MRNNDQFERHCHYYVFAGAFGWCFEHSGRFLWLEMIFYAWTWCVVSIWGNLKNQH